MPVTPAVEGQESWIFLMSNPRQNVKFPLSTVILSQRNKEESE